MPYRTVTFAPNEHYHLCFRGNRQQVLFRSDRDRSRMLFLLTHLQSPLSFPQIGRILETYPSPGSWEIPQETIESITSQRYVALEAFAFMTNHIHLAIREVEEGGTARYMQRVLNGYAKYFNALYGMSGHLFQGPFRSVHVDTNEQLLYLSTYIHRNPRELPGIKGSEDAYVWSSYRDYIGVNRFGDLLDRSLVLDQFKGGKDYYHFCESSTAKEHAQDFAPLSK